MSLASSFLRFSQEMDRLASGKLADECKTAAEQEIRRCVAEGFRYTKAPDDSPWLPLKSGENRKPLDKTGKMRKSVKVRATRAGLYITVDVPYASYHQYGTKTIPARPFLPGKEPPAKWVARVDRIIGYVLDAALSEATKETR